MTARDGGRRILAERALELREVTGGSGAGRPPRDAFLDWLAVTLGGSAQPITTALLNGLGPGDGPSRVVGRDVRARSSRGRARQRHRRARPRARRHLFARTVPPGRAGDRGRARRRRPVRCHLRPAAARHRRRLRGRLPARGRPRADPLRALAHDRHGRSRGAAAAAAADLRDADVRRPSRTRFRLAATMAGGVQQTFRSDAAGKPLHAGAAAQAGVVAAAAARGGVTGAADVFEAPAGFAAATGTTTEWAVCRSGLGHAAGDRAHDRQTVRVLRSRVRGDRRGARLRSQGVAADASERSVVETYAAAMATAGIAAPRTAAERNSASRTWSRRR